MSASEPSAALTAARYRALQRARVLERHGVAYERADRTRQRWDGRWEKVARPWLATVTPSVSAGVRAGEAAWGAVSKARSGKSRRRAAAAPAAASQPVAANMLLSIEAALAAELAAEPDDAAIAALPTYLSIAADTAEDAGQHTLDALGLHETFRWTTARDVPRDLFSVRGSRVLQAAYGSHIEQLARIVLRATDPARPQSQGEVRRLLREEWDRLTASEASRIARTECAAVWETTNYNAQRANGVETFDWLVAHGPSIGPPTSEDVCLACVAAAAAGPYAAPDVELPPLHPNCRCTLIPSLEDDWLPPAETWAGGPNPPLPLVEAPTP